ENAFPSPVEQNLYEFNVLRIANTQLPHPQISAISPLHSKPLVQRSRAMIDNACSQQLTPLSIINSVGHMRRSLLLCALSTVALAFFTAPARAQSRCANAKVSEVVFEQRPEFAGSLREAKTLFVG